MTSMTKPPVIVVVVVIVIVVVTVIVVDLVVRVLDHPSVVLDRKMQRWLNGESMLRSILTICTRMVILLVPVDRQKNHVLSRESEGYLDDDCDPLKVGKIS